jgi:nitroimidazol reductase NimA-like FMN-containing flavoprotein (pyridoxamine 5'-phosphate oxidase superfamily)
MRDAHMEVVNDTECRRLLAERHLGRLAIVDWDGPMIFPVNYVFDQGLVIFRTDPRSKLDAATEAESVAFEIDAVEEGTRTGWSVVVRGTLAEITDPDHLARLRTLPLYPWAPGDTARYVRVLPHMVTDRRLRIPDDLPFTQWVTKGLRSCRPTVLAPPQP